MPFTASIRSREMRRHRGEAPIRLMIVDDSIVARTVLARMLDQRPEFEIAALATSADQALAQLHETNVDIILLDLEMPGTHGLAALPELIERSGGAHVLIVSSAAGEGAATTIKALALGAADTMLKPGVGSFNGRFAEVLSDRLLRMARARPIGGREGAPRLRSESMPVFTGRIECLAIGASTGGVNALTDLFRALPRGFTAPILVTQHLPAVFMPYFAAQLRETSGRVTYVASDGRELAPGEILVAPGDGHLRIERMRTKICVHLDRRPAASGCLPSVDPMLASVAEVYGPTGVAVILSGMGRDGVIGAERMAAAGAEILAQDEMSSVVWGMPGAVANAGLATAVLPPEQIGHRLGSRGVDARWT